MKTLLSLLILSVLILTALICPLQSRADAPQESYFLQRSQITDDILRKSKGVLTVTLYDPVRFAEYYGQPKPREEAPYISIFAKNLNDFTRSGRLSRPDIITPTGGEYGGLFWYRFPVISIKGEYLEIVYNISGNKTCWVNLVELRMSLKRNNPVLDLFTEADSAEEVTIDIFYLTDNKTRLYKRPSTDSNYQTITPESDILLVNGAYDAAAYKIIERKKGFGLLVETLGPDMPVRKIGWIRLKDDNGLLAVWPITGYGC